MDKTCLANGQRQIATLILCYSYRAFLCIRYIEQHMHVIKCSKIHHHKTLQFLIM